MSPPDNGSSSGAGAGDSSYGQVVQPCPANQEKTWIAIQLLGEDDRPVSGVSYRILLPDGTSKEGSLDGDGSAKVDQIDPGTCMVTFPELDQEAWEPI